MAKLFKDREHLVRLAGIFVLGVVVFLVAGAFLVPKGYGTYGRFRAGALDLNRNHELVFAGRRKCAQCHEKVVTAKSAGKHAGVGCESCHGPLAAHAAKPESTKPVLPKIATLCLECHRELVGRPAKFPQVDPKQHNQGVDCDACHDPHEPKPPEGGA